jgi:hypothetical protein
MRYTRRIFGSSERNKRSYECGDKLFRNDNGKFIDVSEQAGIFWGKMVWSRLAVSDFNPDGYPDIYVGNDFHEDDYYYLNNGDGTFSESLKNILGILVDFLWVWMLQTSIMMDFRYHNIRYASRR